MRSGRVIELVILSDSSGNVISVFNANPLEPLKIGSQYHTYEEVIKSLVMLISAINNFSHNINVQGMPGFKLSGQNVSLASARDGDVGIIAVHDPSASAQRVKKMIAEILQAFNLSRAGGTIRDPGDGYTDDESEEINQIVKEIVDDYEECHFQ